MDPVTHALTGYVISNVFYNDSHREKKVYFSAVGMATVLAAVSPDIDSVVRYAGGNTLYFMYHRTYTHSPVGLIVLAALCALGVKMLFRIFRRDQKYAVLFLGALFGTFSHVLLDITNTYSTLALWPFSNKMYSLGLTSIVDTYIIGIYILSILITLFKPLTLYKRKIFTTVIALIVCYVGVKAYVQYDLKRYLENEYRKGSFASIASQQEMKRISVMTGFVGFNTWNFIIENENEFIKGAVDFSSHQYSNVIPIMKKPVDIAVKRAQETPLGKFVLKFSPFIDYNVTNYKDGYLVRMADLRFASRINTGGSKGTQHSHLFGGYIVLDGRYNPISWSISDTIK